MIRGSMWEDGDDGAVNACDLIVVTQGETRTVYGQVTDENGVAVDMTGPPAGSLKWYLSTGLVKSTALGTIIWDTQASGLFHLVLSSTETAALSGAKGNLLDHELWATTPGLERGLVWKGNVMVQAALTTPP